MATPRAGQEAEATDVVDHSPTNDENGDLQVMALASYLSPYTSYKSSSHCSTSTQSSVASCHSNHLSPEASEDTCHYESTCSSPPGSPLELVDGQSLLQSAMTAGNLNESLIQGTNSSSVILRRYSSHDSNEEDQLQAARTRRTGGKKLPPRLDSKVSKNKGKKRYVHGLDSDSVSVYVQLAESAYIVN